MNIITKSCSTIPNLPCLKCLFKRNQTNQLQQQWLPGCLQWFPFVLRKLWELSSCLSVLPAAAAAQSLWLMALIAPFSSSVGIWGRHCGGHRPDTAAVLVSTAFSPKWSQVWSGALHKHLEVLEVLLVMCWLHTMKVWHWGFQAWRHYSCVMYSKHHEASICPQWL